MMRIPICNDLFHLRLYLWNLWPFAKNVMYSVWHIFSNLFDKFCWMCINGIIIFKKLHKIFKICFQSLHELLNNLAFVKLGSFSTCVNAIVTKGLKVTDNLAFEEMNLNQYWSSFSISSICFSLLEFSLHKILHNKMKKQAPPLSFKFGTTKSWKAWNSSWPPKSQSEIFKLSFTNIGSTSIPIVRMGFLEKHLSFCKDCLITKDWDLVRFP